MASAGILFLGLFALWCLASAAGGWPWPVIVGLGVIVVASVVWAAQRLRIADREAAAPFARLPAIAALMASRLPARAFAALRVLASAIGARDRAPVFVRLKLKPANAVGAGAVVAAMSAAPGMVVVDADAGSLLAHVLVEADVDVAAMQALERVALASAGGAAR